MTPLHQRRSRLSFWPKKSRELSLNEKSTTPVTRSSAMNHLSITSSDDHSKEKYENTPHLNHQLRRWNPWTQLHSRSRPPSRRFHHLLHQWSSFLWLCNQDEESLPWLCPLWNANLSTLLCANQSPLSSLSEPTPKSTRPLLPSWTLSPS